MGLAAPNPGQALPLLHPGTTAQAQLAVPDPDLQAVVGMASGPTFLGFPTGPVPAHVLAVPADAPADLGALEPTGRTFDFTDPNGNAWSVIEYRAAWGYAYGSATGPATDDRDAGAYNFALIVDTSLVGQQLRVVAA
ncbi:MAG TPA: hypothetical protein VGR28_11410 [Candidatus Thermoplasmatota archaeon]|nr:hypothetical protein [Candidatus Thermoplasmatota archaeon]